MKYSILFLSLLSILSVPLSAQTLSFEEMDQVLGENWKGTLTYLDYQSEKKVDIPVELAVRKLKEGQYVLAYSYPEEPKANSTSKMKLSKDGRKVGKYTILSRESLDDGRIKIVCIGKGKDDKKPATLFYTYILSEKEFVMRKDVEYSLGNQQPFFRNEFRFTRN